MDKIEKDFKLFATDNKNVSKSVLNDVIHKTNNSIINPQILEERQLNVTSIDIFSRLMLDRILFFGSDFNSDICNIMVCQLLYLNSIDNRDIQLYINSPGGSVYDGLSLVDTIDYIDADVSTTCAGMCASMGAVLLSNGAKDKRFALPHSKIMIHQPSGGMHGKSSDMQIEYEQMMKCRKELYTILSANMGRPYEEIERLCDRDFWLTASEAIEYGIIDKVLTKDKK